MKFLTFFISFLLLVACGSNEKVSGGEGTASETTNGLAYSDNAPLAAARVFVRPIDYIALPGQTETPDATTDSKGYFEFKQPSSGSYILEIRTDSLTIALEYQPSKKTKDLGTLNLKPGSNLDWYFASDTSSSNMWVVLRGLDLIEKVQAGRVSFKNIPEGTWSLELIQDSTGLQTKTLDTIDVLSDVDLEIGTAPDSDTLLLLMSNVEDRVNKTILNYPLWIDLQGFVHPLNRSRLRSGIDISYNSQLIPWQWSTDSNGVWILLDSLKPLMDSQNIVINYVDNNVDHLVFDTAMGWEGVWHFDEADPLRDYTQKQSDCNFKTSPLQSEESTHGFGLKFSHAEEGLVCPGGIFTTALSASMWVKLDSFVNWGRLLEQENFDWVLDSNRTNLRFTRKNSLYQSAGPVVAIGALINSWAHFASVWAGDSAIFYINGIHSSSMYLPGGDILIVDPVDLYVGTNPETADQRFVGIMDELRLNRNTIEPEQFYLDFLTQKPYIEGDPQIIKRK
jgi:hypothetical protein